LTATASCLYGPFDPPGSEESEDVAADHAAYQRVDRRVLGLRVPERPDRMNQSSSDHASDIKREAADAAGGILLVYDWECPACDTYCRLVRIPRSVGTLRLVNAREPSMVIDDITQAGLDIDQGMVVKMGGQLYYGAEAIHILALTSSRSDLFNKLSYYAFRSDTLSRILYPALRRCRNLLLKVMRKTKINNLGVAGNDRF
jgi:predicted DCC family thiol-disulfide oxidoreductase YuxK